MDDSDDEYVSDSEQYTDDSAQNTLVEATYHVKDEIEGYVRYEGLPLYEYLNMRHVEAFVKFMLMRSK